MNTSDQNRQIRVERNFLEAVLENAAALVAILEPDGRIIRWNRTCEKVTGRLLFEVLGRPLSDFFTMTGHPATFEEIIHHATSGGQAVGCQLEWKSAGQEARIFLWSFTCLCEAPGDPVLIIGHGVDISERVQMEQRLRHRLALERMVAELSALLMDLLPDRLTDGIYNCLENLGHFFHWKRCDLILLSAEQPSIKETISWPAPRSDAPGTPPPLPGDITMEQLVRRTGEEGMVWLTSPAAIPAETAGAMAGGVLALPLACSGEHLGAGVFYPGEPGMSWTGDDLRMLRLVLEIMASAFSIHAYAGRQATLIANLQQAFSEIKRLSGLIPICANCKKVRDDHGYWLQVEEYIRDRTDANFSHGICPDCFNKLYPEFADQPGQDR